MKLAHSALAFGLLAIYCQRASADGDTKPLLSYSRAAQKTAPPLAPAPIRVDSQVIAAANQSPVTPNELASPPNGTNDSPKQPTPDRRLLAQPTRQSVATPTGSHPNPTPRAATLGLPKIESFATAGAGLAIVVGLFLVCMWLLKRSGPKPTAPLPREAVAVLGRVPLAARNFAHLLRVGNKLVLVAITPDGIAPITEVTDPIEVQQLLGLCQRHDKQSTTAEFHNVLQQLAKEPTSGFLGNEARTSFAGPAR